MAPKTDYDYSQMWNASGGQIVTTNKRGSTILSTFDDIYNVQRQRVESVQTVLNVGETSSTTTTFAWAYDNDGHLTDETSNDGVMADYYHNHYQYDPGRQSNQRVLQLDRFD